jgi:hypothetical protein
MKALSLSECRLRMGTGASPWMLFRASPVQRWASLMTGRGSIHPEDNSTAFNERAKCPLGMPPSWPTRSIW